MGIIFYLVIGYPHFYFGLAKLTLLIKDSLFFMAIFIIITLLASVIEESQKKHLPFAIWAFIGVLITILLKGLLISLILQ